MCCEKIRWHAVRLNEIAFYFTEAGKTGTPFSIYSRRPMPHSPTHARPRSLGLLCSCALNHLSIQFGEKHFNKLLKYDIGDNFLSIIQNMYSDAQYRVKINNLLSPPKESCVGEKQGCVRSLLLFNLYLSDFPKIFEDSCDPVSIHHTVYVRSGVFRIRTLPAQ